MLRSSKTYPRCVSAFNADTQAGSHTYMRVLILSAQCARENEMKKWYVTVVVMDTIEVEAETQEQAETKAVEIFDATANDPEAHDSWEIEND